MEKCAPKPREATSVAIMMGERPLLNSPRTQSLSCCCYSRTEVFRSAMNITQTRSKRRETNLVAVDRQRRPTVLTEVLGEVVGDALGRGKDEDLAVLGRDLFEVPNELLSLVIVGAHLDDLRGRPFESGGPCLERHGMRAYLGDVDVRGEVQRADGDLDKFFEVRVRELLDLTASCKASQRRGPRN